MLKITPVKWRPFCPGVGGGVGWGWVNTRLISLSKRYKPCGGCRSANGWCLSPWPKNFFTVSVRHENRLRASLKPCFSKNVAGVCSCIERWQTPTVITVVIDYCSRMEQGHVIYTQLTKGHRSIKRKRIASVLPCQWYTRPSFRVLNVWYLYTSIQERCFCP